MELLYESTPQKSSFEHLIFNSALESLRWIMVGKAFIVGANTLGLRYSESDASLIKSCLEQHGYQVYLPESLDKHEILRKFDEFIDNATKTDTLIFYYSGHGYSPKGTLFLVLKDDLKKNQNLIEITHILSAFENVRAPNRLVILDCCNAGNLPWNPEQPEQYRILTATEFLQQGKEFEELKAGFLSFYICKAFTESLQDVRNEQGKVYINTLFEWLNAQVKGHNNNINSSKVPEFSLLGNQGRNFELFSVIVNNSQEGNSSQNGVQLELTLSSNGKFSYSLDIHGEGTIDPGNIPELTDLIRKLRKYTDDESISIVEVKNGSIKLTLQGSPESLHLIASLIESGKLTRLEGFSVKNYQFLNSESELLQPLKGIEKGSKVTYCGTGRRKTATARVRLVPGTGILIINGRLGDEYLQYNFRNLAVVKAPLETLGLGEEYDILVNVKGGGLTGQAEAIRLGVARSLCELDPENRKPLKIEGHLTRDPRSKERKKYGLKKARKAPQYSKR